ncbi:uncharacterized protein LOC120078689 isoform X2 [Benincasa hispida]|uniref:uncharacterized protein LOC120078689 isoform X2 n=1 Tax=Benincasa hispida TaxID=102211 RepID=UPI0018FFAB80|nr:uncharacterized protein LOC120078689 isoform X2 [Benincasa hispida]
MTLFKMFRILGPKLPNSTRRTAFTTTLFDNLGFHRDAPFTSKFFSSLPDKGSLGALGDGVLQLHGFTVSYLVNSCGMPLQTALEVASKLNGLRAKVSLELVHLDLCRPMNVKARGKGKDVLANDKRNP